MNFTHACRIAIVWALASCGSPPAAEAPEPIVIETLDVLAYNVWMLPPIARDRMERAAEIPHFLMGYDVVVLSEAFEADPAALIAGAMVNAGYQATPVLGASRPPECRRQLGPIEVGIDLGLNGGVMILSRDPVEYAAERFFDEACVGEDCCSAKGVLYARVRRADDRCVHVFGTHLQNQSPAIGRGDPAAVRNTQLQMIREFIDAEVDGSCPGPVVVAGDLNLQPPELPEALSILRARDVPRLGPSSWGEHNAYAESDAPEHLDYVLVTSDFEEPAFSFNETRIFRASHAMTRGSGILGIQRDGILADLSDHHAVAGHFEWGAPLAGDLLQRCANGVCSNPPQLLERVQGHLCGPRVDGVFCDGLAHAPCNASPRRCMQVVDPASTDPTAFDDYLCYRARNASSSCDP